MAEEEIAASIESGYVRRFASTWAQAVDGETFIGHLGGQDAIIAGALNSGGTSFQLYEGMFRMTTSGIGIDVLSAKVRVHVQTDGLVTGTAGFALQLWGVTWDGSLNVDAWKSRSVLLSDFDLLAEVDISALTENADYEFESAGIAAHVNLAGSTGFLVTHSIMFQDTPVAVEDKVFLDLDPVLVVSDVPPAEPVSAQATVGLESKSPKFITGGTYLEIGPPQEVVPLPPFSVAEAVVPNDLADLPGGPAPLVVSVGGSVVVRLSDGVDVTYAVASGQIFPFPVSRVMETGTTAMGIKALR